MSAYSQSVATSRPPSNTFNLSHDVKLSLNMGWLVPVLVKEVVPGDSITLSSQVFARMAPLISPVMHKIEIDLHTFYVPNRIVWENFYKFVEELNPDVNTPAPPYFADLDIPVQYNNQLGDYLGLPKGHVYDKVSALPFAAYKKIWYDYYRNQNIMPIGTGNKGPNDDDFFKLIDGLNDQGGTDKPNWITMEKRCWEHDYFTSALPWPQRGESVTLPIGTSAPVVTTGQGLTVVRGIGGNVTTGNLRTASQGATGTLNDGVRDLRIEPNGTMEADLTDAGEVTVNALRWAIRLQEYLEKQARGGTRTIEYLKNIWGVTSSDKRFQRAEFIGGSRQNMVISEVLQTSETTEGGTPIGSMGGHGISVGSGNNMRFYCEEHGFIMTLMSIRPRSAYQQGLDRMFSRFDALDYANPFLAELGEQEIKNKELYYDRADNQNDNVFGYVPRYSEYKYAESRVCGDFRDSLSQMTMSRIFSSRPHLNALFLACDPTERVFAVEDGGVTDKIWAQVMHNLVVRRSLPKYGIPTI